MASKWTISKRLPDIYWMKWEIYKDPHWLADSAFFISTIGKFFLKTGLLLLLPFQLIIFFTADTYQSSLYLGVIANTLLGLIMIPMSLWILYSCLNHLDISSINSYIKGTLKRSVALMMPKLFLIQVFMTGGLGLIAYLIRVFCQ